MVDKMEMSYVEIDIGEIDFHGLAEDPRRRPFEKLRLDRGMRKLQRRCGAHWQNPVDGIVTSSAARVAGGPTSFFARKGRGSADDCSRIGASRPRPRLSFAARFHHPRDPQA